MKLIQHANAITFEHPILVKLTLRTLHRQSSRDLYILVSSLCSHRWDKDISHGVWDLALEECYVIDLKKSIFV